MKLNSILESVIEKSGGLQVPKLGGKTEKKSTEIEILSISDEVKQQLLDELRKQSEFNNKLIITIIIGYFIIFALAVFVVIYNRDSPALISIALGGSILSLLVVIASMRKLLKEKHTMDLIRITIPNLSSEQAMVMIQTLYYEERKPVRKNKN